MSDDELRELLTVLINRHTNTLDASTVAETGGKSCIGVEDKESGAFFCIEITEV